MLTTKHMICIAFTAAATTLLAGCPAADSGSNAPTGATGGTERLVHLEARFGDADGIFGDVSYKVRRRQGELTKQFKVQLENDEPGTQYEIRLNDVALGKLIVGVDGEGEMEFEDDFPENFVAPEEDAVVAVGDAFSLTLAPLERLAKLVGEIDGIASGEVSFKKERLAGDTHRELEIEVEDVEPGTYDVTLDGQKLATIEIDDEGEGEMKLGGPDGDPFPADFRDPGAGSILKIGSGVEVTLESDD
jgi:hypothetical protein